MGFDPQDRPFLSYVSFDPVILDTSLRVSYFDGFVWQHMIADSVANDDVGLNSALAIDPAGRVAVAYSG